MGYYSEWKLVIGTKNGNNSSKFNQLITWMEYLSRHCDGEQQYVFQTILGCKQNINERVLEFSDASTKCYSPWESAIEKIFTKTTELDLAYAYVRLGEYFADVEERSSGGDLSLPVNRSIGDVEFY